MHFLNIRSYLNTAKTGTLIQLPIVKNIILTKTKYLRMILVKLFPDSQKPEQAPLRQADKPVFASNISQIGASIKAEV